MPLHLKIQVTKRNDGGGVLKCIRADGSETWQKQNDRHAPFFALHDLTHFAVESELGIHDAFFGLIAGGWSIEDTTGKGSRGALPAGAIFVEHIVGTLDAERGSGSRWSADEFNETLGRSARSAGWSLPRPLTDDDLAGIRKRRAELFDRWHAIPAGRSLELTFPP